MIEGKKVCKAYPNKVLFKDYSFFIEDAEYVCFSGKSGSGKTTLLNMIGMLEAPDSGKILINNTEIKTNKEKMLFYRNEVGFIFQNFALIENQTVKQNLDIVKCKDNEFLSLEDALDIVGLKNKLNAKIYTLSGGEQQRVAIARLYLKRCNIILADEPTGSLDRHNAEIVITLLEQLNKLGKTLILVTHDEIIRNRANRIITLA